VVFIYGKKWYFSSESAKLKFSFTNNLCSELVANRISMWVCTSIIAEPDESRQVLNIKRTAFHVRKPVKIETVTKIQHNTT